MGNLPESEPDRGIYSISMVAELLGTGIQNLRLYERRGLLTPSRSDGGTRRYSADDLTRLRRVGELLEAGVNLAGVAIIVRLEAENTDLKSQLANPGVRSGSLR